MNLVIRNAIYIYVFLAPFIVFSYTSYPMIFSKSLVFEGVTLFIAILWIINKLLRKEPEEERIPRNAVFLIFGLYVLATLISGLNSIVPGLSFWGTFDHGTGTVFMLCLFLFSLILSSVFKKLEDWYKLFTIFIVSGIAFTLGTFLSEMGVKFSSHFIINASGGFLIGNSSWAGIYLAFVFFISFGLIFSSKSKSQKIIGIIGLVATFLNPIITGLIIPAPDESLRIIGLARASLYSIFAGTGFFVLYMFFRRITSAIYRKIIIGIFIAIFVAIPVFIVVNPAFFRQNISETAGPNRLIFWDIAVDGFKEHPVLGWGGDSYQYVYAKYFDPLITSPGYSPEYWVDRSHSIYFDELVTGGVIGFTLLMSLYCILLFGLLRNGIRQDNEHNVLFMALASGLISFLIAGLLMFQTVTGWVIVSMLIAFVANFCFKDRNQLEGVNNKKDKYKIGDKNLNIFLSFLAVISFCILFNYLIIKPYGIAHGLAKFPTMPYNERLLFYKELDKAYMGNTTDLGNAFLPYHVRLRQILQKGITTEEKKLMVNEIKEINKLLDSSLQKQEYRELKILMAMSGFYSVAIALTDDEERQSLYDEALLYIEKMKLASPGSPTPEISKALLDISLQYGEEGLDLLNLDKDKVKR